MAPAAKKTTKQSPTSKRGAAAAGRNIVLLTQECTHAASLAGWLSKQGQNKVYHVHTLRPQKVCSLVLSYGKNEEVPETLQNAETVLRKILPEGKGLKFVIWLDDPLRHHLRLIDQYVREALPASEWERIRGDETEFKALLEKIPASMTTGWVTDELNYLFQTNFYKTDFQGKCFWIGKCGAHDVLFLLSHVSSTELAEALETFLGIKGGALALDSRMPDEMIAFGKKIYQVSRPLIEQLAASAVAQHFFGKKHIEPLLNLLAASEKMADKQPPQKIRTALLDLALRRDLAYADFQKKLLENYADTEAEKFSDELARSFQGLTRARNNLFVAGTRHMAAMNAKAAAGFVRQWSADMQDPRGIKLSVQLLRQAGDISQPLHLLEKLPQAEQPAAEVIRLNGMKRVLQQGYVYTPKAKTKSAAADARIVYYAHQTIPFHTSGYATRTHGLAKKLHQAGWPLSVITRLGYPADAGHKGKIIARQIHDGLSYRFFPDDEWGRQNPDGQKYFEQSVKTLVAEAGAQKATLIHCASNYLCGVVGVEAARRLKIPSIYEMRGLWHVTRCAKDPDYRQTEHFAMCERLEIEAARNADYVLAITGALKEYLVARGVDEHKVTIAPNAVDLEQFSLRPKNENLARKLGCEGKVVIGYIGSFVAYEGLDLLVTAAAQLKKELGDCFRLLWVGDGVVLPALMSQAKKLNVDDMIISLGRQPFEEVPNLYSLVDVSAFPRKGFEICEIVSPLKPFESMAMGKAVVVSSVRPLQEIVTHKKTGLVHEKDNAESLAEALRVMITKPALRQKYAAAAREWLVATRNWDKIAADVSAVYETLSQKKPKQKKISEKKTLKSTTQKTQPRGRAKGSVTKKTSKKEKTSP